ncbi:zinc finger domain-containing protein [Sutcliffiella horikoshii]
MKVKELQQVNCEKCKKLLGKLAGELEIKCTRCKTINNFRN